MDGSAPSDSDIEYPDSDDPPESVYLGGAPAPASAPASASASVPPGSAGASGANPGPVSASQASSDRAPVARAANISVSDLQARHPLWQKAARASQTATATATATALPGAPRSQIGQQSRASASGGAAGEDSAASSVRYERLSSFALEIENYRTADGAESSIGESEQMQGRDKKHTRGGGRRGAHSFAGGRDEFEGETDEADEADESGEDEYENEDDEGLFGDEPPDGARRSNKRKGAGDGPSGAKRGGKQPRDRGRGEQQRAPGGEIGEMDEDEDDTIMAAAALGGTAYEDHGLPSDADSCVESQAPSVRRERAQKAAFPIRGVRCVGCALASRIGPVERFVYDNCSRMSETALYKSAALAYKREIEEPCAKEGVDVPPWHWKDIRSHFECHKVDDRLQSTVKVRLLANMRMQLEQRLVRVDESGNKELDSKNSELMLKILDRETKERSALNEALYGKGGAGGGAGGSRNAGVKQKASNSGR